MERRWRSRNDGQGRRRSRQLDVRWRRRDTKSREREGRDGDGEPCAQCHQYWRWAMGMFVVSHGKKMEEQE
jgi:hypothetical protein